MRIRYRTQESNKGDETRITRSTKHCCSSISSHCYPDHFARCRCTSALFTTKADRTSSQTCPTSPTIISTMAFLRALSSGAILLVIISAHHTTAARIPAQLPSIAGTMTRSAVKPQKSPGRQRTALLLHDSARRPEKLQADQACWECRKRGTRCPTRCNNDFISCVLNWKHCARAF